MDLVKEISRFDLSKMFNSAPSCSYFQNASPEDDSKLQSSKIREIDMTTEAERSLVESIWQDDKSRFISSAMKDSAEPLDRWIISALLRFCCTLDSVECATALINGELGEVPLVNEIDETGRSVLHLAAEMQAPRCVDLLLRKRARTDLKTKDKRAQLALELSLSSLRMDVTWCPDESSIEDLVVLLIEKDLTALRLLSEKTEETAEVAYTNAIEGCIMSLTALLIVATEKVNESILELRDGDSGTKEKTTVYECVIREALALGRGEVTPSIAAKRTLAPSKSEIAEKRKLLLREIELLQLFGAVAQSACLEKKTTPLLIRAAQEEDLMHCFIAICETRLFHDCTLQNQNAGDETIMQMLMKTNIDVNDTDAEGNSALHWSLKISKSSSPQQIKILSLLLRRGARVNLKNMMGLTAVHIAAANGNSEALQVLLSEDPDTVNYKTQMKETPLFYAVKNDHTDCVELLLRWGANSEVLNLRRQRCIDLANSQDMRFILNPINITLMSRSVPGQQKHTGGLQGDEHVSETCQSLLALTNEGTPTDRTCSNAKTEICKYYDSHPGCQRGSKCSFAHGEEDLRQLGKRLTHHSIAVQDSKRRIFVGGLPITLESGSLGKFFEEFGPVEDAVVVGVQLADRIQSRGFGFVTFKHEKSASAAVQEHYVTIMGKHVEIKSVIPKFLPTSQVQKLSPQQEKYDHHDQYQPQTPFPKLSLQQEKCQQNQPETQFQKSSPQPEISEHNDQQQPRTEVPNAEEAKPDTKSWVDRLLQGQPKTSCSDSQPQANAAALLVGQGMPAWLRTFKRWFPGFLKKVSAQRDEDYALSSLKADFRSTFGIELDHASIGYPKLSDFMRSFPGFCHMKIVPVGRRGPATHIILLPKLPVAHSRLVQVTKPRMSAPATPADNNSDGDSSASKCLEDNISVSSEGNMCHDSAVVFSAQKVSDEVAGELSGKIVPHGVGGANSEETARSFLEFMRPDPLFLARPWLPVEDSNDQRGGWIEEVKGIKLMYQKRHLVLEALSRKWNSSSAFFLREFDFYHRYYASIKRGLCFGCNQQKMIWANAPCQHFVWCNDCKKQAVEAAGFFEHKCVVCDRKVQSIDLIPGSQYCQATCQFPPLNPYHIMSPSENRPFPLIGY